jgi:hypothetical protein
MVDQSLLESAAVALGLGVFVYAARVLGAMRVKEAARAFAFAFLLVLIFVGLPTTILIWLYRLLFGSGWYEHGALFYGSLVGGSGGLLFAIFGLWAASETAAPGPLGASPQTPVVPENKRSNDAAAASALVAFGQMACLVVVVLAWAYALLR